MPVSVATYACILEANGVAEAIRVLPTNPLNLFSESASRDDPIAPSAGLRDCGQMDLPKDGVCSEKRNAAADEAAEARVVLEQRFDVLVLEASLFEVGLFGRKLVPFARQARLLCTPRPQVFPCR